MRGTTVPPGKRDSVAGLAATPPIVSISDIHGFLEEGRSALLALGEHPAHDPVVEADADGRLHWAGNDYVLVVNGDLVDRGPANDETVAMFRRLVEEAPAGRVRATVGNHEMALMLPAVVSWPRWYSGRVDAEGRRRFYEDVLSGAVVAAYGGHRYTYAHAGRPEPYDPGAVNDDLAEATDRLSEAMDTPEFEDCQRAVCEEYAEVFGTGGATGRGPGAGITWLDFEHMPPDAPPQVVGHTRHDRPTRKGNVVCENVLRENRRSLGGESVLVETPETLYAVRRTADGGVERFRLE